MRVLDNSKIHGIRNTFGRDANDILDNSMSNDNVSLSSSNYETIKKIRHLLSEEKIADARRLRDTLQIEGLYAPLLEIDLFIQRRERELIDA